MEIPKDISKSSGGSNISRKNDFPPTTGACEGPGGAKGEINNLKQTITLGRKLEMIKDARIWKVIVLQKQVISRSMSAIMVV